MAIGNYTELQAAVADWLARSDLTDKIPTLISVAEASFNRDIRVRQMLTRSIATTTAGDAYVGLPADFLEARSLTLQTDPKDVLDYQTPQALNEGATGASGRPTAYTIVGEEFSLSPTPDSAYSLELLYYAKIPALNDTTQPNNWLLTAHPDVYLYGTLAQTAPYLRDDERITVWGTLYDRALQGLKQADDRAQWNGGPLAMRVDVNVR